MYIGLFAGAFKPFTSGHYSALMVSSKENDVVYLFVSTKDRVRKGELPITFEQTKPYWKLLKNIFPSNVKVIFTENPAVEQFNILKEANQDLSDHNSYTVYADDKDINRYKEPRILKALDKLVSEDQLDFKAPPRQVSIGAEGGNISGTKMRDALKTGNIEWFVSMLPPPVQQDGFKIYHMLKAKPE